MRRILFIALFIFFGGMLFAQSDSTIKQKVLNTKMAPRSNDHFMLQLGYTTWTGQPDSINTDGIPRTFNAYFLFDFPFKTNPRWSAAIGAGIGTDNIFFDKTYVGIKDATPTIRFQNLKDTNSFKKYKLATSYLEAPVELRYRTKPEDDRRSVKVALGLKAGILVNAHTKGKTLENKGGNTINDYKVKEFSKRFFNKNRLAATARLGYGHFSLFGSYQITTLFKEGLGPDIRPLTVGLTLSGL
ncbi:MAG: outer membrane beta-barrel protein [Chitinophagaceae bacterium]